MNTDVDWKKEQYCVW